MASISQISEQIMLILGKRGEDSDVDVREIRLAVRQSAAQAVRMRWFEGKNTDGFGEVDGSLVSKFDNEPVVMDGEEFYTTMPANPVDIPGGVGIRSVAPMKGLKQPYRPVPNGFCGLHEGLESFSLEGRIGFFLDGDRIYYVGMSEDNKPDNVRISMVLGIDSLEDDQEINIPSDMQGDIINYVVQLYSAYKQDDDSNDSTDIV